MMTVKGCSGAATAALFDVDVTGKALACFGCRGCRCSPRDPRPAD